MQTGQLSESRRMLRLSARETAAEANKEVSLGLGQYVFPRMAVHIASGRTVPVERLRAHCLWYPAVSLDGREVSGHVLYFSKELEEALGVVLGLHGTWDWNPTAEVENGEDDITFRLAAPVRASRRAGWRWRR